MDKEQILAQMGVTQWRLREPVDPLRPAPEAVVETEIIPAPEPRSVPETLPQQSLPNTQGVVEAQEIAKPASPQLSFNAKAITVTGNSASNVAGKTWVFMFEKSSQENTQEEQLLSNILKAINFASVAEVQQEDRQAWLQGLQVNQVNLIVLIGEVVAAMAFPDKPVLAHYKLLPQQTSQTITPVLALPNLAQLLKQPQLKREVWAALQEAIRLSQ